MNIEFNKVSEFNRGTIFELLADAYSFDYRCAQRWSSDWKEFDNFFFDNLQIADKYGFITTLNNEAIGMISWDPRNIPDYIEIGHNCIVSKYKNNGYLDNNHYFKKTHNFIIAITNKNVITLIIFIICIIIFKRVKKRIVKIFKKKKIYKKG